MRRDNIKSARGEVVDFDSLIQKANTRSARSFKTDEVPQKIKEVQAKQKLSGHIPSAPILEEEIVPADAAMITVKKKKPTEEAPVG